MAFAGLWEAFKWPNGDITRSYCIITTDANSLVAPIHDRCRWCWRRKTGRSGLENDQAM
jgi:putative SOS response-associated peptidase YedK